MYKSKRVPTRFQVTKVSPNLPLGHVELMLTSPITINEKVEQYRCLLTQFWINCSSSIQIGDYVNVFDARIEEPTEAAEFSASLIVDNGTGLLVIKPDILISATTLMSTSFCMRKTWLSRLFEAFGDSCKPLLIGNVVHELFQESLKQNMTSVPAIMQYFKTELLDKLTLELYSIGIGQSDLIAEIEPYIRSIFYWINLYKNKDSKEAKFLIQRLHEIENSIWSTKYGLIGKVDVSLEVTIQDKIDINLRSRNLVPLELKTGKHTFSHQHIGQVILYSFIMAEKYPHLKPTDGFLLYLKDQPDTVHVKSDHNMFRDLLILRNTFVPFYDKLCSQPPNNSVPLDQILIKGPEPINNDRLCQKCENLLDCSLVYRCFESKQASSSAFDLATAATSHLNSSDLEFFSKTISLLEIEKQCSLSQDKSVHFWNIRSEDCEKSGIGLSKMQVKSQTENYVIFERSSKAENLPTQLLTMNDDISINYSQLEERRVVISEELISSLKTMDIYGSFCKKLCLAIGTVSCFSSDTRSIEIHLEKNQINMLSNNSVYRIDFLKNLSTKAMTINFSNIVRLMSPNDDRCRELRDIVIRGQFPKHNVNNCNVSSLSQVYNSSIINNLNVQQKKAVVGVLKTRCSLIFGSPGSGKTQTIVALLQILVQMGYSVLVTSFTHVAVDNILLKLMKSNANEDKQIDFLRVGAKKRIHSELKEHADYYRTQAWLESGDIAALENFYNTVPIVASTCLGIFGHPLFNKKKFDFCILDEASQVYLATCLGPIFMAQNFVLVGDQKQLPPVIMNQYARKQGLEESLFARLLEFTDKNNFLSNANGDSYDAFDRFEDFLSKEKTNHIDSVRVFPLFIQYRMNCIIMELANKLTYSGKLKCANKDIEMSSLRTYLSPEISHSLHDNSYLDKAISPSLEDSVIFLDTDGIAKAMEISVNSYEPVNVDSRSANSPKVSGFVFNDFEAHVVQQLVHTLLTVYQKGGLTPSDIGVISPFRRQVMRIRELLSNEFVHQKNIEINTVDQYQGRDKEVIIYSCVKSFYTADVDNEDSESQSLLSTTIIDSELLKDERRLNVAITRAKKKLIVIGNRSTLSRYNPFKKMFNVLDPGQYVQLVNFDCSDIVNALEG